jgi:hypothetical protein
MQTSLQRAARSRPKPRIFCVHRMSTECPLQNGQNTDPLVPPFLKRQVQTSLQSAALAARGPNVHSCPPRMDIVCPLQNGSRWYPVPRWTRSKKTAFLRIGPSKICFPQMFIAVQFVTLFGSHLHGVHTHTSLQSATRPRPTSFCPSNVHFSRAFASVKPPHSPNECKHIRQSPPEDVSAWLVRVIQKSSLDADGGFANPHTLTPGALHDRDNQWQNGPFHASNCAHLLPIQRPHTVKSAQYTMETHVSASGERDE